MRGCPAASLPPLLRFGESGWISTDTSWPDCSSAVSKPETDRIRIAWESQPDARSASSCPIDRPMVNMPSSIAVSAPRAVSWVKAARKAFQRFPGVVQDRLLDALAVAALGETAAIVKPMKGFGPGVLEVALPHRGNAFRVVYAVKLGEEIWIVHAFQKKSKAGIKTPKAELDVIRERLKRLKEML